MSETITCPSEQALLLRGSREFESVLAYQTFIDEVVSKDNERRGHRVELAAMRELGVAKLPEYVEEDVHVSEWSTVRVKHCAYSVPSRLKGEWVRVRIYEHKLEVDYAGELQLSCERLLGRNQHRIDYRHVIWSLMRKPGGFARYVYREEMFPQPVFRATYDAIQAAQPGTQGDVTYLRILHLAASTLEADVAVALAQLEAAGTPITVDAVKTLIAPSSSVVVPPLAATPVDLAEYDTLLDAQEASAKARLPFRKLHRLAPDPVSRHAVMAPFLRKAPFRSPSVKPCTKPSYGFSEPLERFRARSDSAGARRDRIGSFGARARRLTA